MENTELFPVDDVVTYLKLFLPSLKELEHGKEWSALQDKETVIS